jgi:crotonobetainyl-CoA:carnitine CoA-transferase CaiB-like acyl-CoA transferase
VVPSATLKTGDGRYVIIGGNGDSVYTRLMAAVGRPDMGAHNPLYANNAERCKREAEIYEVTGEFASGPDP